MHPSPHFLSPTGISGRWLLTACVLAQGAAVTLAQSDFTFSPIQPQTNREMRLQLSAPKGANYRIDAAPEATLWTPLISLTNTTGSLTHTDTAAPFLPQRFYRAVTLPATNTLTGDYLPTAQGEAVIRPVNHATMVIGWGGLTFHVDPAEGYASRLRGLPLADVVLITHDHSDHYSAATIAAIKKANTVLVVAPSVYDLLPSTLKPTALLLTNGATAEVLGVPIRAVPAYNGNHPKGEGNGYVLTLGGKHLYISGDTDDIAEMRALTDIDVAFVCMDGAYNMTVAKAASVVREFRPKVVYPYHYLSQSVSSFKRQVGTDLGIEVRLRKWE